MKMKRPLKIAIIVLASLVVLALVVSVGVNIFINKQLPKIIAERNDTAYDLTYEKIHFSVLKNTLSINNVLVQPKENTDVKKEIDFFGEIKQISVSGVNFYELIKNKNLKAFTISIVQPDITFLQSTEKDTLSSTSKLTSVVDIDKINIEKAHLKMMDSSGDSLLREVFNFNAEVDGIHMGTYTVDKDIPFTYTDYSFKIDSLYSVVNDLQIAKSGTITIEQHHISVDHFRLLPYVSSQEFKNNETHSNTRLLVEVPKLSFKNTDWGYDDANELYVRVGTIAIDSMNVKILDQKEDKTVHKKEEVLEKPVQSLIPFRLDVAELIIQKSSFNSLNSLSVQNVNIQVKKISNRVEEQLLIGELQLNNPELVHISSKKRKKKNNHMQLNDVVLIDQIKINNAAYTLKNSNGIDNKLTVSGINLSLENIRADDQTVLENIPFTYKNLEFSTNKIHFNTGKNYNIYANAIETNGQNVTVKDVKIVPKMTRKQHASRLKYAEDHYDVTVKSITLNAINWGFDRQDEFYIKLGELVLDQMNASVYRDVSIPRNPKENRLYSYRLRHLDFPMEIARFKIKNSRISYEEDTKTSTNPGKLTFSNFNLTADHLYSGYKKTRGPKTQIFVNTKFMQQGDLAVSWQFDIMNRDEWFNINGNLKNFPATAMNPFLKPYINVNAEGKIDEMVFNFSGNNDTATGEYAMNFENLKMTLFNKENKERKILTAAANAVVRSETDGLKKAEIKPVDRKKDASFFNFLWLCIMQGLKQTVL